MGRIKTEGFAGQRLLVLPRDIVERLQRDELSSPCYLTDMGTFPEAKGHCVERPSGHESYIVILCHGGQGWCECEGQFEQITAGSLVVLPCHVPHRYGSGLGRRDDREGAWEITWLHFQGGKAEALASAMCAGNYGRPMAMTWRNLRFERFSEWMSLLERGLTFESCHYVSMALWQWFADLIYGIHHRSDPKDPVEQIISVMEERWNEALSLDDFAGLCSWSPPYLCRRFKAKTGYSPMDYFIRLKVQKACQFLDLTSLDVQEISKELGYRDPYYFSRCFKKVMGQSPLHYRREHRF